MPRLNCWRCFHICLVWTDFKYVLLPKFCQTNFDRFCFWYYQQYRTCILHFRTLKPILQGGVHLYCVFVNKNIFTQISKSYHSTRTAITSAYEVHKTHTLRRYFNCLIIRYGRPRFSHDGSTVYQHPFRATASKWTSLNLVQEAPRQPCR